MNSSKLAEVGDRVEVRFGEVPSQFIFGEVKYVPTQVGDCWVVDWFGIPYQFMSFIYIKIIEKG